MSVIEKVKAKIQKLKQRINELKCQVIAKHQIIGTHKHQLVMLINCSLAEKANLIKDTEDLIDEGVITALKLQKKIAKKETLLRDLEEYHTLYYKRLEVNSHDTIRFSEKLICQYFNGDISDRMKELELKINKPKLFKPDEVVPVSPVKDERMTKVEDILGYQGARIDDKITGQGSMWLRDKRGRKYKLIVSPSDEIFTTSSVQDAYRYLLEHRIDDRNDWEVPNLEELDQLCLDYLNANRFKSRITPIINIYRSSTRIRTGSEPIESIPLNIDGSYCVDFYSGSIDQKDDGIECLIRPVKRVYS